MDDKKLSDYISKTFPKLLERLLATERKDKRSARKMKKGFSSIDDYIWKTSGKTPFISDEGIKIYMNEVSFHMLDMMFPDEKLVENYIDSTGAYAKAYELVDDSLVYVVIINSDVYDFIAEKDLSYIKYFTIAHELGHCINDDPKHPLDVDSSIAYTEKRMECKECIERELNADRTGYDKIIYEYDWFGDFEFNSKLTLTTIYRRYQHVCNWLFCRFGRNGLKVLEEYFKSDNILDIGSHFLNLKVYNCNSTEDKKRRRLFEKCFC